MRGMADIKAEYWGFYLDGREERRLKADISIPDIAQRLLRDGGDLRKTITTECERVRAANDWGKVKRKWIAGADPVAIKDAGGDAEQAYAAWLAGRADELAFYLESKVLAEMFSDDDDDEEGEGGDDDEEEEGEDDEGEK
jgi:hypothetical protein